MDKKGLLKVREIQNDIRRWLPILARLERVIERRRPLTEEEARAFVIIMQAIVDIGLAESTAYRQLAE